IRVIQSPKANVSGSSRSKWVTRDMIRLMKPGDKVLNPKPVSQFNPNTSDVVKSSIGTKSGVVVKDKVSGVVTKYVGDVAKDKASVGDIAKDKVSGGDVAKDKVSGVVTRPIDIAKDKAFCGDVVTDKAFGGDDLTDKASVVATSFEMDQEMLEFNYQMTMEDILLVHPHVNKDIVIVNSGCSRSMTCNKEKLDNFVQVKGGIVTFRGGDGKITGRGTIRTSKLDFKNVYYVEELQNFNLFSVS
nr:ribonuclease H-like domain-containing protein [Tanacetum cinerariifolium]